MKCTNMEGYKRRLVPIKVLRRAARADWPCSAAPLPIKSRHGFVTLKFVRRPGRPMLFNTNDNYIALREKEEYSEQEIATMCEPESLVSEPDLRPGTPSRRPEYRCCECGTAIFIIPGSTYPARRNGKPICSHCEHRQ